jgi:hypothetical protein
MTGRERICKSNCGSRVGSFLKFSFPKIIARTTLLLQARRIAANVAKLPKLLRKT